MGFARTGLFFDTEAEVYPSKPQPCPSYLINEHFFAALVFYHHRAFQKGVRMAAYDKVYAARLFRQNFVAHLAVLVLVAEVRETNDEVAMLASPELVHCALGNLNRLEVLGGSISIIRHKSA